MVGLKERSSRFKTPTLMNSYTITLQRINKKADVIMKEKVEFAKRMLPKRYSMEETIEIPGFTATDIPRLKEFKRNQKLLTKIR